MPDDTVRLEVPMPDAPARDVLISLPEDYDPARAYPVWLAFPGRFITPGHMSTDTGCTASDTRTAEASPSLPPATPPNLVAGVVGVSGIYYNPGTPVSGGCAGQPVPVMIIRSRNDGLSLIGAAVMAGIHAAVNGCGGAATTGSVAPGVTAHVRQGCAAATELILSESDRHGWPRYSAFEAWRFLSVQSR